MPSVAIFIPPHDSNTQEEQADYLNHGRSPKQHQIVRKAKNNLHDQIITTVLVSIVYYEVHTPVDLIWIERAVVTELVGIRALYS